MEQAQLPECRVWIDEFGYAVYIFKASGSDEFKEVLQHEHLLTQLHPLLSPTRSHSLADDDNGE